MKSATFHSSESFITEHADISMMGQEAKGVQSTKAHYTALCQQLPFLSSFSSLASTFYGY